MSKQPHSKHEKGQSLVELAVSVVVILILLAGVVDLARLALAFSVVRDAAQEAATFGAAYPTYCEAIASRALNSATGNFAPASMNANVQIVHTNKTTSPATVTSRSCSSTEVFACSKNDNTALNQINVTVTGQFSVAMPLLGGIIGQNIPVSYTVANDILRPVCP